MTAFSIDAPAKVNLYLHVTGKRADGYHLLDSLVVFAGVGDTLVLEPAETLSLDVIGPTAQALPEGEENIVLRAAQALAQAAGVSAGARMILTKRLPVAAGIGGGSADAAAALKGLARLWNLSLSESEMAAIGLKLGADVPVCLAGRPTTMTGIGDHLVPAPALPPAWAVLVNPRLPLSTPAVFKARQGDFTPAMPLADSPADARALAEALAHRRNDLTHPAIACEPVVGEMLALIAAQAGCLLARMSGSGATCFGLFATAPEAEAAAAALSAAQPGWWVAPAPLLA
ncbi:MAG TPA: 4-(cytidine 5'-diphospho)-2-C-methyl-D-erythritol kinase [Magnetospirillum sp.]|jgi:4-diphosphocytidyl-2-C-methyl-D-erythritol kinase|nr:4-(cytidine 5'-diphospho)-2-C-methyl-D-erythritol kinase [Magnetospirillum sp.]